MNYRKIIILPAFFVLSNLIYIGCCKCPDSGNNFFEISNPLVEVYGDNHAVIDDGMVTHVDTVFLQYSFDNKCVAMQKKPFLFLVNEVSACKCNECGFSGPKSKISSISITSDSIYNGLAANSLLNIFFKVQFTSDTNVSIDSLKNFVNAGHNRFSAVRMFTTTKPANDKSQAFSLKINFEDGTALATTSNRIFWM
ncbi:MAG: hypothetical protein ABIT58_06740 [Ferruginibacter sp.]